VKRAFFLLNVAFAMEILDLISHIHIASFVVSIYTLARDISTDVEKILIRFCAYPLWELDIILLA
jgi:hypothetical protein